MRNQVIGEIVERMSDEFHLNRLESRILKLLLYGYSTRDISETLNVSIAYAKAVSKHVIAKTGFTSCRSLMADVIEQICMKEGV